MKVAGFDIARRRDFSGLVVVEQQPRRMEITHCIRLPQISYREQAMMIAPAIETVDLFCFDASGVGDAVSELLPTETPTLPVVIVGGNNKPTERDGRWMVPKPLLLQNVMTLAGTGRLHMEPGAPGRNELMEEMQNFMMMPTVSGRPKLEAKRGTTDDLVLGLSLAIFGLAYATKRAA